MLTNNKGRITTIINIYLDIVLTSFLKFMQQIKCKYVTSTVHFWKLRYILPLLECALYSKWNQIMNWYLENTFFVIFFLLFVCISIRGVHFACVQKECSQYNGFPGSQAAQIKDQARECIPLWCSFWTEAWAGPQIACTPQAAEV